MLFSEKGAHFPDESQPHRVWGRPTFNYIAILCFSINEALSLLFLSFFLSLSLYASLCPSLTQPLANEEEEEELQ